jgi:hypothetical protein
VPAEESDAFASDGDSPQNSAVQDASGTSLGVANSLLDVEAAPGDVHEAPVTVFNDGDVALDIEVINADLLLDEHGRATPDPDNGDRRWSAASWLTADQRAFTLEGGEERDVWIRIEPPADAEPGTHRALVLFRGTPQGAGADLVVRPNVAVAVLVTVPGDVVRQPAIDLDFPGFTLFTPEAEALLANSGNVHYFADGAVEFTDRGGDPCGECDPELPRRGALVLPGESRAVPVSWAEAPLFGVFDARADFTTTDGETLSASDSFLLIRWQLIAAILIGVIFTASGIAFGRKYRLVPREESRAREPGIDP